MNRDMDLIREILFKIEESGTTPQDVTKLVPDVPIETARYHIRLLVEAELVTAVDVSTMDGENYLITGLTWAGHDFLDAARSNERWEKAKSILANKGGGMVFDVVKQLLVKLLSDQVLS